MGNRPPLTVIHLARKPLTGTVASNVLKYGTGGLNIDKTRIGTTGRDDYGRTAAGADGVKAAHPGFEGKSFAMTDRVGERALYKHAEGRWPANLILSHLQHVWYRLREDVPEVLLVQIHSHYGFDGALPVDPGEHFLEVKAGDIPPAWQPYFAQHRVEGCKKVGEHFEEFSIMNYLDPTSGNFSFFAESYDERPEVDEKKTGQVVEDWECVEGCPCRDIDEQSGVTGDSGGASRYFKQVQHEQDLIDYLCTLIGAPGLPGLYCTRSGDDLDTWLAKFENNTVPGVVLNAVPTVEQFVGLLRVLMPGGHVCLFAPDEQPTGHTGACLLENIGFEIRDAILWVRGSGRTHYVAKAARQEREAGCQQLPSKKGHEAVERKEGSAGVQNPRAGAGRTAKEVQNFHPCLHPDALVMTEQGYRPISEITLAQQVYGADGRFHYIEDISRHPYTSEHLYEVAVLGTNYTTLASDNHPFLIWRPVRKGKHLVGGEVDWVRAQDICKGDYTMTPLLTDTGTVDGHPDEWWWVFGLWLAEGVLQRAGHGANIYPSFTLHRDETDLIDRLRRFFEGRGFNLGEYPKPKGKGVQVIGFDPEVGAQFKEWSPCGASHKRLPRIIWWRQRSTWQAVFDGYMAGDGGQVRTYRQAKTVSPDLASQMRLLGDALGAKTNLFRYEAAPGKIGNRVFLNTLPYYQMRFYGRDLNQQGRKPARPVTVEHEGMPYRLAYVQKVTPVPYTGDVWNLTVNGSPTFQTAVGMSHNTVKPIDIMVKLLADVPLDRGPVVDPFLGCYDDQTEVLTRAGWKHFRDASLQDWFLTRRGDQIEYQLPTELHCYPFAGEMVRVHSRSTDLLVTPNHNMWVKTHADFCAGRDAQMLRADALEQNVYRVPAGGAYQPESQMLDRATMHLIGLYVSEGYLDSDTRYPNVIVCPNQGMKWDQMMEWLAPFQPTTKGKRRISVRVPWSLYWFLEAHCGHSKYHKSLSPSILSNQHLDALFEAMVLGDGHTNKKDGSIQYWTVSPGLAGAFQELCVKLNKGSTLRVCSPKPSTMADGRVVQGTTDVLNIGVTTSVHRKVVPAEHVRAEQYVGDVFCATVPNHTLYVRRNGCTAWCGNSGTTLVSCLRTGHDGVGIEREPEYLRIAEARVRHWDRSIQGWVGAEIKSDLKGDGDTPQAEPLDLFDLFD